MKPWDQRDPALRAMLERKGLGDMIPKPKRKNASPEEDEQRRVVKRLDVLLPAGGPVFWSATLNGVRVPGGLRGRLTGLGLRPGVFDLVFIRLREDPMVYMADDLTGVAHWIEMKAEAGALSKEQRRIFTTLHPRGLAQVCRTVDEVEDQLRSWGFIP